MKELRISEICGDPMKFNSLDVSALFLTAIATAACGQVVDENGTPPEVSSAHSYQTTSNVGDLSTWTIDGNQLSVEWKDIAPVSGAIERTYSVSAICGSVDPTFGDRTCLVDGDSVCTPGTEACGPDDGPKNGETFTVFEIPGMALVANVEDEQLHAGFAAGDCAEMTTDDYTFINLGLGQGDIFGLFRTDSTFSAVKHMDFGFSDSPEGQISYTTGDPGGVLTGITPTECSGGVRDLIIGDNDETVRLIMTAAGHFIIDKAEGEGGLIAVNGENVATIEDFADRQFGGIAFPDDRAPELLNVVTGPAVDGRVQVLSIELSVSGDITPETPVYINDGTAGAKLSAQLLEPKAPYATNHIVASGSYTSGPSSLPGMFEIDPVSGDETAIIGLGASQGGKTILFGSTINEFDGVQNAVKGNFILVEK